jgi:DNA polymerase-4
VTLKLKRNDFRTLTRRITLPDGTQTADRIYRTARALYDRMDHPEPYRLIGVGLSDLMPPPRPTARRTSSTRARTRRAAEDATDRIRARFGPDAILKGRALR